MAADARLEMRIDPAHKALLEKAARLTGQSVTQFVAEAVLARSREVVDRDERSRRPSIRASFGMFCGERTASLEEMESAIAAGPPEW